MMYSVRLDNNKKNNYYLNFGDLPQVAKYGDALYRVVSVGSYNNRNIPLPLVTVDHRERKEII